MEVVEFRFISLDEQYDKKYEAWSRIYEYPLVLTKLRELGATSASTIHNSSWGFEGCHVTFKNDLDAVYHNTLHTDVRASDLPKTALYDITRPAPEIMNGHFDFVINISTIEEVGHDNVTIIKNLYNQVKLGGYLVVTFDYHTRGGGSGNGSIELAKVEEFVGRKIDPCESSQRINGHSSALPHQMFNYLNCGLMILKKTA